MLRKRRKTTRNPEGVVGANESQFPEFGDAELALLSTQSDTEAALHILRRDFPRDVNAPPVLLKSQIYAIVDDRTEVDRQIEKMRAGHLVKLIRLLSEEDEYGIILQEDHMEMLRLVRDRVQATSEVDAKAIETFLRWIAPEHTTAWIKRSALQKVYGVNATTKQRDYVSVLIRYGFLAQRSDDSYWLCVPGLGRFLTQVRDGRAETRKLLRRRREALQTEIVKHKFKSTKLGGLFHVRDLVGLDEASFLETSSGILVRPQTKS